MKRSEINEQIRAAIIFFKKMNFLLPEWATWKPEEWKGKSSEASEIIENMLGWDLTDFGSGKFHDRGLLLFTLRNGNPQRDNKTYAEKVMIVEENQETPMHFHWSKMEDIINRGGGNLVVELFNSDENEKPADTNVEVSIGGLRKNFSAGSRIVLNPGQSICFEPGMYHRFYGESGKGKVLLGEVSAVNDDKNDNRFLEKLGRFPEIVEDEPPLHLLVSEYQNFV